MATIDINTNILYVQGLYRATKPTTKGGQAMEFESLPKGFPKDEFRKILEYADLGSEDASSLANDLSIAHGEVESSIGETDIMSIYDDGQEIKVIYFESGGNHSQTFSLTDLRSLKQQL